jgi:hypothetical protein
MDTAQETGITIDSYYTIQHFVDHPNNLSLMLKNKINKRDKEWYSPEQHLSIISNQYADISDDIDQLIQFILQEQGNYQIPKDIEEECIKLVGMELTALTGTLTNTGIRHQLVEQGTLKNALAYIPKIVLGETQTIYISKQKHEEFCFCCLKLFKSPEKIGDFYEYLLRRCEDFGAEICW